MALHIRGQLLRVIKNVSWSSSGKSLGLRYLVIMRKRKRVHHSWFTGFPGDLDVSVTYTLAAEGVLRTEMEAIARSKATPVSLAQHT